MDSPTSPTDAQPEDGKALEGGAELEPSDKQAAQVFESALEPEPQVRFTFGAFWQLMRMRFVPTGQRLTLLCGALAV